MTITATDLHRFMNCNGSSKMQEPEATIEQDQSARNEGIAADWVIEQVSKHGVVPESLINVKSRNGVFITVEMLDYFQEYLNSMKDFTTEVNTDWNDGVSCSITGRADRIKFDALEQHLHVHDFKYGRAIVEPENNWTLISHAIGWYIQSKNANEAAGIAPPIIKNITFAIYQPRASHYKGKIRTWSISFDELLNYMGQIIEAVKNPKDILNTGEHCYKCPFIASCPASRKAEMNGIDATENLYNEQIDNDELDYQLDHLDRALKIITQRKKAFEELAKSRLKKGETIKNRSLEKQLSNTTWKASVTPEFIEMITGKDLTNKKLVTPTQARTVYGIGEEIIATFTERTVKGVKMVRIDANTKAQKIFNK